VARARAAHPGRPVEVWAEDEHRVGLKPVRRRVWAPVGARPVALGHHRYEWLHVTAFVQPTSGEAVWHLSTGLSKPLFEALLAAFARQTGAGRRRSIVLVLDNAGWHGPEGLAIPDGISLVFLPPTVRSCSRPSISGRWSTSLWSSALRHARRPRGRRRRTLPRLDAAIHQAAHRVPLVAQAEQPTDQPDAVSVSHRNSRPAADETCGRLAGSVGGEVGFVMVRTSPRISWIRDA
jgi:hypothetical protein